MKNTFSRLALAASLMIAMNAATAASTLTALEQADMVEAHNALRDEVGSPNLKWSAKLADTAQAWADTLKIKQACKTVHSHTPGAGENLYWASPLTYSTGKVELVAVTAPQTTASWGSEKKHYSYDTNSCAAGKVCGHYTQLVWKKSTEIGCGKAICNDKSQVWVCQYAPAGNYLGQSPY
ncbi:MAG: CAP domain-containing protein [Polaromonas sp.]|nr:CAP domain-containing protein [Polaromonas sp.]